MRALKNLTRCNLKLNKILVAYGMSALISIPGFAYHTNQNLAYAGKFRETPSSNGVNNIEIKKGNYLVVGAFSYLKNAQSLVKLLTSQSENAELGFYPSSNNYYVYLFKSSDVSEVREKRDVLRKDKQFEDAWVLTIDNKNNVSSEGDSQWAKNSIPAKKIVSANSSEAATAESSSENGAPVSKEITFTSDKKVGQSEVKKSVLKEFKIYVNSFNATNFKELKTNVKLIYGEKDKLAGTMESHNLKSIMIPVDDINEVQLECNVFGYKKAILDLNVKNPINEESKSYLQMSGDSLIFDFELIPYKKGDVFTMYNVYFHNDAAIMQPRSGFEVNSLLEMAKSNEQLKIRLHGHTNGNTYGKIITMGKEDKDFFNLRPTNESGVGTAKKLSFERALTIKNFLVSQGIEENRIEVIGWGGKKSVYETKSIEAKKNARVEVEILQN